MRIRKAPRSTSSTLAVLAFATGVMMVAGCGGKYRIRSEPSDASVTINGVASGRTPLDIPVSKMPSTTLIEIRVEKEGLGAFQGFVPGPTSGFLGNEVLVHIPKIEDDATKVNRNTGVVVRAQQLIAVKRYDEAMRVLDEAIKENPAYIHAQSLRASVLFLTKSYPEAAGQWRKVLALDPANTDAKKMLNFLNTRGLASGPVAAEEPKP